MYNKATIRFGFSDIQNNQGLAIVLSAAAINSDDLTLTSTLITLDITNTKSNNIVFKIAPGKRWNLRVNHTLIRYMYVCKYTFLFLKIAKINFQKEKPVLSNNLVPTKTQI